MIEDKSKLKKQLSVLVPMFLVKAYSENLRFAGMTDNPRVYAAQKMITSFKLSFIPLLISFFLTFDVLTPALYFLGFFIGFQILFFIIIMLKADTRAKEVDKMLPDALQLMSANVRAGMTIDKALWLAARPEFGVLEEEFRKMASETLGGKPITRAFRRMTSRVNSKVLHRASMLIIQGIELGGSLSKLLNAVANDIRTSLLLQNEINASTSMYTLFIVFASVFASPLLFAVSTFYVETTSQLWDSQIGDMGEGVETNMNFVSASGTKIDTQLIRYFALGSIAITTFFGSLIIGLIRTGSLKTGLRYIPFFVTGGILMYLVTYAGVNAAFGSVLGF